MQFGNFDRRSFRLRSCQKSQSGTSSPQSAPGLCPRGSGSCRPERRGFAGLWVTDVGRRHRPGCNWADAAAAAAAGG